MSLGSSPATTNVTLTIGGRDYTVACAPGEEGHVTELGKAIAAKLEAMPSNIALGEARALLFASLLLADELYELRLLNQADHHGGPAIETVATPAASPPPAEDIAGALDAIAARLENIATHLEHGAASA